jgi:HEAT repeat protein
MAKVRSAHILSLFVVAAVTGACNRQPPPDSTIPPPAPAPPPPPAAAPAVPSEPAKPAAPEYSPAKAAELLKQMEGCQYDFNCAAYKPVVAFGTNVSKDLIALALDESKKGHTVAAQALGEIKDPAAGLPLFEAARKTKDFMQRTALGTAAGKSGGDELFKAATKLWSEKITSDQGDLIERALSAFGDRATDWALQKLAAARGPISSCTLANVVKQATAGRPEALPKIQAALPRTKHTMARHRLAAAAIALGDVQQFDQLAAGLKDPKDDLNRSDAANMLSDVVEKLPAARKDEFVKLLEAAQKKGKGHLEERGINESLKKLKA